MRSGAIALALALGLPSCTQVEAYGKAAAELRRVQNDLQAQGTLDALCDLSVGSVARLPTTRQYPVLAACWPSTLGVVPVVAPPVARRCRAR